MQITEIRIHLMNEDRLKAFVSVTFDNCFVVRNMKIVQGNNHLFICMPSRKEADDEYRDLAHPITREFRGYLEKEVFQAYEQELKNKSDKHPATEAQPN